VIHNASMAIQTIQEPCFPPVTAADSNGLLMLGGELSIDWLLAAYRQGIFPWPIVEGQLEILAWFSPDPRAIIELDQLHVPRRLARKMRSGRFLVTSDQAFDAVLSGCAGPRHEEDETWITPRMMDVYRQLHGLGYAHSVEVWEEDELVGGLYGLALGGYFSGESMYHRTGDASKIAICALVKHLGHQGFELFDIQQSTPHCSRLGASEIGRDRYLERLTHSINLPVEFGVV